MSDADIAARLSAIIVRGLRAGHAVEIEGLGTFHPDAVKGLRFEAAVLPQVFIAYVKEDEPLAVRLFTDLEAAGFYPWIDVRSLLPGQNWPRAIERAIESSDFFVPCFSANSVSKKGGFQAEIRYALDCVRQVPLDEIFIVPVRLDACNLPRSIRREFQYVDLFPDRRHGVDRLIRTLRREFERRSRPARNV